MCSKLHRSVQVVEVVGLALVLMAALPVLDLFAGDRR